MKNRGITLISLIITVIVLLILAGVTLAMVMGDNGIIAKAQTAKERTNNAQDAELNQLADYEEQIDNYITRTGGNISYTLLWEGNANTTGEYKFKNKTDDTYYDIDDYDFVYIVYSNSGSKEGNISSVYYTKNLQKDKQYDIYLTGYGTRSTSMHFINEGFYIDGRTHQDNYFYNPTCIIGIKL